MCSGRNQVVTKHGRVGAGWAACARERSAEETDNKFKSGKKNRETNLHSDFQEP